MKIVLTDINGQEKIIRKFKKLVLKEEEGVPAHTLLVRFHSEGEPLSEIAFMRFEDEGKIVFDGIVDTIIEFYSEGNYYFEVFGRNRVSLLLDNEVMPAVYSNPTSEQIKEIFLKPYGFSDYVGGTSSYNGIFNVAKGKSPWDIIESFCKTCYETIPYCSPDNVIYFTGLPTGEKITFGKGFDIDFSEYRFDIQRHKIISSVKIKRSEAEDYSTEIFSQEADKRLIQRQRYLNASNTQFTPVFCAEKMLLNGINNSRNISLKCSGLLSDCLGAEASVSVFGRVIDNLKIYGLQINVGENQINTVVELRGNSSYVDT